MIIIIYRYKKVEQMGYFMTPNPHIIAKQDPLINYYVDHEIYSPREYDYSTLLNPLVPPLQRNDYIQGVIGYPTRGYVLPFKKMGILISENTHNDDKYKFLILMGRQTYLGSNYYEYYAVSSDNSVLKFELNIHKELDSGDIISISELNKKYSVKMDKMMDINYYPYI